MIHFTPSPIVATILHPLLDMYERPVHTAPDAQTAAEETPEKGSRALRVHLNLADFPLYYNQADPTPRASANEQLQTLARSGYISLAWLNGEQGHLLASVTLEPAEANSIFKLLRRTPLAAKRGRLIELLLSEKFRYAGWRLRALQHTLAQLRDEKSPAPFSLSDDPFNQDLLIALAALDELHVETPQRVFSVHIFNDSKRFEDLASALATLARRHAPEWQELTNAEVLRELNLVANPSHIYLHGAWQLVDADGLSVSLAGLSPSVGIAAAQAARTQQVSVNAPQVIAVEYPTSFYELMRTMKDPAHITQAGTSQSLAAICLMGTLRLPAATSAADCRQGCRCSSGQM